MRINLASVGSKHHAKKFLYSPYIIGFPGAGAARDPGLPARCKFRIILAGQYHRRTSHRNHAGSCSTCSWGPGGARIFWPSSSRRYLRKKGSRMQGALPVIKPSLPGNAMAIP